MINSKDNIETYKGNTTNYSKNTSVSKNKTIIVAKLIHERNNEIKILREKINKLEDDIKKVDNSKDAIEESNGENIEDNIKDNIKDDIKDDGDQNDEISSLKELYNNKFSIGVALNPNTIGGIYDKEILKNFNRNLLKNNRFSMHNKKA